MPRQKRKMACGPEREMKIGIEKIEIVDGESGGQEIFPESSERQSLGKNVGSPGSDAEPSDCQDREACAGRLKSRIESGGGPEELEALLWETLRLFQGYDFTTAKGLTFRYSIRGNEMFVDRKEKSITRASVSLSFQKALEVQREWNCVSGPKKLGTFGASYLYPVFLELGVIKRTPLI